MDLETALAQLAATKSELSTTKQALADTKQALKDTEAKLAAVPDAAKAAKRLEQAEAARDEAKAALATREAEWASERVFLSAGIHDADAQAMVRVRHERAGQGKDLQAWLDKEGRDDPFLAHLFATEQAEAATEEQGTETATTTRAAPPSVNRGAKPAPGAAKGRDITWLQQQPVSWRTDKANQPEIDRILGRA